MHGRDQSADLPHYASTRLTRVFVPYLPIGVGLAAAYLLLPGLSEGGRSWTWAATISLLPLTGQSALLVAWTLTYELIFYAVVALGIVAGRPFLAVVIWSAIAIAYNTAFGIPDSELRPFFALTILEFLFGALAAFAIRRAGTITAPGVMSAVALGAYAISGQARSMRSPFGLAMAFLVVALVRLEMRRGIAVPRWLLFLGAASYSIYLVHTPIVSIAVRLSERWIVVLLASVSGGLAGGVLYHLVFERPAMCLVRRPKPRPPARDALDMATPLRD